MRRAAAERGFDFTNAQWTAIEAAIASGCESPSSFDRAGLLRTINAYRERQRRYVTPSVAASAYKRAERLLRQAAHAIEAADVGNSWTTDGEHVATVVRHFQLTAAAQAGMKESANPRSLLFDGVLRCWTKAGGRLAFSRKLHPSSTGGPTVRYLQAATGPVIGRAPTVEGIRKIIERCRKQHEELLSTANEAKQQLDAFFARWSKAMHDFSERLPRAVMSAEESDRCSAEIAAVTIRMEEINKDIALEFLDDGPGCTFARSDAKDFTTIRPAPPSAVFRKRGESEDGKKAFSTGAPADAAASRAAPRRKAARRR